MTMNKGYILLDVNDGNAAGPKARNDVCDILVREGYEKIVIFNRDMGAVKKILQLWKALGQLSKKLQPGDRIVVQYPYRPRIIKMILDRTEKARKRTGAQLVILIHDVLYMRGDGAQLGLDADALKAAEIAQLSRADYVVAHNERMAEQLRADGMQAKQVLLGIFDYLSDAVTEASPETPAEASTAQPGLTIAFAGNFDVNKGEFVYHLDAVPGCRFHVYGVASHPETFPANVAYKGSFSPEALVGEMEGDYGLIWDGPETETCEGRHGNYLRVNNPHKASLYLAAGLPIVVWKEAAIARFVEENGVGVAVESLNNLTLPAPESAEYKEMRAKAQAMSHRIRSGEMLKTALYKCD